MNGLNLKAFGLGILCASAVFVAVGWKGSQLGAGVGGAAAVAISCSEDGQHVYAADLEGVHVSQDYGKSWTKVRP